MLFNSPELIFIFVPIAYLGFFLLARHLKQEIALFWLFGASLFFYAWWNPPYLLLLLCSMIANYGLGEWIGTSRERGRIDLGRRIMIFGIVLNLTVLGYFKYFNFFIDTANHVLSMPLTYEEIILPLGISFFTFQKIAFLVDRQTGQIPPHENFLRYGLFVAFFPQLIAGPIVHFREIMPQFRDRGC